GPVLDQIGAEAWSVASTLLTVRALLLHVLMETLHVFAQLLRARVGAEILPELLPVAPDRVALLVDCLPILTQLLRVVCHVARPHRRAEGQAEHRATQHP